MGVFVRCPQKFGHTVDRPLLRPAVLFPCTWHLFLGGLEVVKRELLVKCLVNFFPISSFFCAQCGNEQSDKRTFQWTNMDQTQRSDLHLSNVI